MKNDPLPHEIHHRRLCHYLGWPDTDHGHDLGVGAMSTIFWIKVLFMGIAATVAYHHAKKDKTALTVFWMAWWLGVLLA